MYRSGFFYAIIVILWCVHSGHTSALSDILLAKYIPPVSFDESRCLIAPIPVTSELTEATYETGGVIPPGVSSCIRSYINTTSFFVDQILESQIVVNVEYEIFRSGEDILNPQPLSLQSVGTDTSRYSCSCPTSTQSSARACLKNLLYTHLCTNSSQQVVCRVCTDSTVTTTASGCLGYSSKGTTGWVLDPVLYNLYHVSKSVGQVRRLVCRNDIMWFKNTTQNPPAYNWLGASGLTCYDSEAVPSLLINVPGNNPTLLTYSVTTSVNPAEPEEPRSILTRDSDGKQFVVPESLMAQTKQEIGKFGFAEYNGGSVVYSPFSLRENLALSVAFKKCYKSNADHIRSGVANLDDIASSVAYDMGTSFGDDDFYQIGGDLVRVSGTEGVTSWTVKLISQMPNLVSSPISDNVGGTIQITKVSQAPSYDINDDTVFTIQFIFTPANPNFPKATCVVLINDFSAKSLLASSGLNQVSVDVPNSLLFSVNSTFCVSTSFDSPGSDCQTKNVTFIKTTFDDNIGNPMDTEQEEEEDADLSGFSKGTIIPAYAIALACLGGVLVVGIIIFILMKTVLKKGWYEMRKRAAIQKLANERMQRNQFDEEIQEAVKKLSLERKGIQGESSLSEPLVTLN